MDKLDIILLKNYIKMKEELIPPKKDCPKENLLWDYTQGLLKENEKEQIEGHLLACAECLESLKVIRMIQQAEESPQELPAHLYKKAKEILQNELKDRPVILKIALLWDQLLNKITQLKPEMGEMIIASRPQLQPVRKSLKDVKEALQAFPYRRSIKIKEGKIFLEIEPSGKEGYLILKIALFPRLGAIPVKVSSIRVLLYKSDRICSSVYLNNKGEGIFTRIKEGHYSFELIAEDRSLGIVELSLVKRKK